MTASAKRRAGQEAWFGGPARVLVPLDPENAREELRDVAAAAREEGLKRLAGLLEGNGPMAEFLGAAFDLSPFLRDSARRRPATLDALFGSTVDERLAGILAAIGAMPFAEDASEAGLMADLRTLKGEAHALIALSELAGEVDALTTVRRLSDLADACVKATVTFLLRDAHRQGKLVLPDPRDPAKDCGWIVLGMGKLGAHELNFSSDIDLIVFFEPEAPAIPDRDEAMDLFSRLTRRLVRILQDRTDRGYVFRTDLRLRPDPGSTPLAIPVEAALTYYEGRGQNWERAAMIKARPIAGDIAAGERFLGELRP
jgi:glutamate-ammonia-ligase adenylyltransferase